MRSLKGTDHRGIEYPLLGEPPIVEYARTREFHTGLGYDEEARIRGSYGPDDHKAVFWQSLV